jgi:ribosome maturation factor RimP
MPTKEQEIEQILFLPAQKIGFEIVDVEYIKEEGKRIVRIYIDKENGINISDCQRASRLLGTILDETDIVEESYILEVSSPGIYRPLKRQTDYQRFIGSKIRIQTLVPYNNQRNFCGQLLSFENETVKIDDATNSIVEIEFSNIKKANLEPEI